MLNISGFIVFKKIVKNVVWSSMYLFIFKNKWQGVNRREDKESTLIDKKMPKLGRKSRHLSDSCLQTVMEHRKP